MRTSGILLPVASLPSPYGIGCFSAEAYRFVDQLARAGQKIWQILPLGPTGYGNSPYQSFSTFAGNPFLIDLESFVQEGLLKRAELCSFKYGKRADKIEYPLVEKSRKVLLRKAFERFVPDEDFGNFTRENGYWLEDYALYRAVKASNKSACWTEWDASIRDRHPLAIQEARADLERELQYYRFIQYKFFRQWEALKKYANERGISIIGDMPIYVSLDSSDAWANPLLFQFNEKNEPIAVAGCPPDYFAPQGQLWGNPLYSWEYHRETGYSWWIQRMRHSLRLYDVVRIDHFRGFDEYYSVPYGAATAEHGHWVKGPGLELFRTLKENVPELNVIAEDLGLLTESVFQLVRDTGYPGMKVLQFAFDSDPSCLYLPHNVAENSIMYTGTHDNDTLRGWLKTIPEHTREYLLRYVDDNGKDEKRLVWKLIRLAIGSVSERAVIPMQDYLLKDTKARMNIPSTVGDNWQWRMQDNEFDDELADRIRDLTVLYGRN